MTSSDAELVRRGVVMVGPPYLYNGAQVCGRRTGRTCIFLLASFGVALTMIGLVFLTGDLRMESGLWVAGVVFILLGVVLLVWFLTLCCAARVAFKSLPSSHPARVTSSSTVLVPPRSSTYQLLPMTPTRTQVTPASHRSATQTLPISVNQKVRAAEPAAYPTWGHGGRTREYVPGQPVAMQPAMYTWANSPRHGQGYAGRGGYTLDSTLTGYSARTSTPVTVHTLTRPSAPFQQDSFSAGYSMIVSPTHGSPRSYVVDDKPPPYHTVVSGP